MIKIIKGTYGLKVGRVVEAMTPRSPAFSLSETRETELVELGVAIKVEIPTPADTDYSKIKIADLREFATMLGIDTSAVRTKKEIIAMLEAAQASDKNEAAGIEV